MTSRSTGRGPLTGLRVLENSPAASGDATRAAVAFAGLLSARLGADVQRVMPEGGDPMSNWPPHDAGGSVLYGFLSAGKSTASDDFDPNGAILITDCADAAEAWPSDAVVLVTAAPDRMSAETDEYMIMARTGLLDIFGDGNCPPQPLPGHQVSYFAGMTAFDAVTTAHLTSIRGGRVERQTVSLLDVALWVNWKHFLAGWQGNDNAGLRRTEEWTTLRCRDGYIALTFQDKDMGGLAEMCGNEWFRSPELSTRKKRSTRIPEINAALEAWTRNHDRADIAERAKQLRLPVGPVLNPTELLSDRHMDTRAFLCTVQGNRTYPRLPVLWNGAPVPSDLGAAQQDMEQAV